MSSIILHVVYDICFIKQLSRGVHLSVCYWFDCLIYRGSLLIQLLFLLGYLMSSENSIDSSFGWRGEPRDMNSPSNSEEVCVRLIKRRWQAPWIGWNEAS